MVINVKGLPQQYSSCEWHKNDEDLKKMLDIHGTKIADGYGKTLLGKVHFLYEKKSKRHLMKAITQLQETTERLIDKGQPLEEIFIQCKCIGKPEKSSYSRKKMKTGKDNYLWDINLKRFAEINYKGKSFQIKIFYYGE